MRNTDDPVLLGLGERHIVSDLIMPHFPLSHGQSVGIGDDCAVLNVPFGDLELVATIDPCPTPVICLIEKLDFYHYGRLTALINVSDLAAMGATPVGLLVSTIMPESMRVADYDRFLSGLAEACEEWMCPVVGGNIKDGPEFSATGAALGFIEKGRALTRRGAKPGDRIIVVGEMGLFWAATMLRLMPNICLEKALKDAVDQALYKPEAKIKEGMALAKMGCISACMDSSDGVTGCLYELATLNAVDVIINGSALHPHPAVLAVAHQARVDPRKLMLAWGDWELVCSVPYEKADQVCKIIRGLGTPCGDIGWVEDGAARVWLQHDDDHRGIMANLASERFSGTSYFTHGLESYLRYLMQEPLVKSA